LAEELWDITVPSQEMALPPVQSHRLISIYQQQVGTSTAPNKILSQLAKNDCLKPRVDKQAVQMLALNGISLFPSLGSGCIDPLFLTSALVGGEWSTSRPGRFTTGERAHGTHWIGGWVDLRAGLDNLEKRKFLTSPGLELRPLGRLART
jgi:hypothetical protein